MERVQSVKELLYKSEFDPQHPYFKKPGMVAVCTIVAFYLYFNK